MRASVVSNIIYKIKM